MPARELQESPIYSHRGILSYMTITKFPLVYFKLLLCFNTTIFTRQFFQNCNCHTLSLSLTSFLINLYSICPRAHTLTISLGLNLCLLLKTYPKAFINAKNWVRQTFSEADPLTLYLRKAWRTFKAQGTSFCESEPWLIFHLCGNTGVILHTEKA